MSDIDTTPVEYTIRYACDHEFPATGIAEHLSAPECRYADGVLTVPCDCARCLDIQPLDDATADALLDNGWPWAWDVVTEDQMADIDEWPQEPGVNDGEDQFGVSEPYPTEEFYLIP